MLVRGRRADDLAGGRIDPEMSLRRAFDAVGPEEPGVKPLRRVRGPDLGGEHRAHFVEEGQRVGFGGEVAALPTPISPAAGETAEDLAGVGFVVSGEW